MGYYGSQAQTGKFAVQTSAVSGQQSERIAVSKSQGSRVELAPTSTSTSPYIFIVKTTEPGTFVFLRDFRLGACCLTILIYMFKECLRVRCAHATPTFPDLKA